VHIGSQRGARGYPLHVSRYVCHPPARTAEQAAGRFCANRLTSMGAVLGAGCHGSAAFYMLTGRHDESSRACTVTLSASRPKSMTSGEGGGGARPAVFRWTAEAHARGPCLSRRIPRAMISVRRLYGAARCNKRCISCRFKLLHRILLQSGAYNGSLRRALGEWGRKRAHVGGKKSQPIWSCASMVPSRSCCFFARLRFFAQWSFRVSSSAEPAV
jgi:hypothetical protein